MFNYIGIDWGEKRTGVAFGNSETKLVVPIQDQVETPELIEYLAGEIEKKDIGVIVVGMPTNFVGGNTRISTLVGYFIEDLKSQFPALEIITVNERGTSKDSHFLLNQASIEASKTMINNLSAAQILERYFTYNAK
jgi:RNase H-fold protein (predicted Holliday junction resolvase)